VADLGERLPAFNIIGGSRLSRYFAHSLLTAVLSRFRAIHPRIYSVLHERQ